MNKEKYLQELKKYLKVLSEADRDEAISFYEEYFDDAGVENEAKVIEELGSPKDLSKKILVDVVDRKYTEDADSSTNDEKTDSSKTSSLRTLWIVLAALLALPLSPILAVICIVFAAVIFALVVTMIALIVAGFIVVVAGVIATIVGLCLVVSKLGTALTVIGCGLVCYGVGALLVVGFIKLLSLFCKGVSYMVASIVHKKK